MQKKDSSSWSEIKSLVERLERFPDSFCFARLSEVYLNVGLVSDALQIARQGVARHPGYLAGQRALAMSCNASGQFDESRTILELVTAAVPEDTDAQKLLASLFVEAGDKASAIRAYMTLLDFRPDDAQSRALLEELQKPELLVREQGTQRTAPVLFAASSKADKDEEPEDDIYELTEDDVVYDDEENVPGSELDAAPEIVASAPDRHDPLSTYTLAELYEQQGFVSKALDIYRSIYADDPANLQLQAKIATLERQIAEPQVVTEQVSISEPETAPEQADSAAITDVAAPIDSRLFSPLANQKVDDVVGTLECWLENIRRIKACR